LKIIETKTKKNPVQVLVTAVENGSPRDEITVIEHAGARYPQAVDCSPMRRVDIALRWMVIGAYGKAFGKKKKMAETLADEIIKAGEGSMESYACSKRNEAEKQADSAR
jgi:small subunit ribosomal protein S7